MGHAGTQWTEVAIGQKEVNEAFDPFQQATLKTEQNGGFGKSGPVVLSAID